MAMTGKERALRFYHKKRMIEQRERWNDILDKVYLDIDAGKFKDDIIEELLVSGYRILNEDKRATNYKKGK